VPLGHQPAQFCPADRFAQLQADIVRGAREQYLVNPLWFQGVRAPGNMRKRVCGHPASPSPVVTSG
jgi:hypothetical protein